MKRRDFLNLGLLSAIAPAAPAALAQSAPAWPTRPVRLILSQPTGSGPDIVARYLGEQLSRLWPQPLIVENRPGGQNLVGAQAAARAAPDGYTFYFGTTAALVTNAYTFKSLPYDPAKDFVPVRLVGRSPFLIATGATSNVKDLGDAISQARAQPGQIAMASEGTKTFSGMLVDYFANRAGIQVNHVPYSKTTDAIQDVIAGRVPLVCMPHAALSAYLKAGQMRALAVSTGERVADLPQVPTLGERFPGFEYTGWNGFFAPAGTPPAIVTRLNRDLETISRQQEVVARMATLGSIAVPAMTVAEFEAFMRRERDTWAAIVKAIGIQPE